MLLISDVSEFFWFETHIIPEKKINKNNKRKKIKKIFNKLKIKDVLKIKLENVVIGDLLVDFENTTRHD